MLDVFTEVWIRSRMTDRRGTGGYSCRSFWIGLDSPQPVLM